MGMAAYNRPHHGVAPMYNHASLKLPYDPTTLGKLSTSGTSVPPRTLNTLNTACTFGTHGTLHTPSNPGAPPRAAGDPSASLIHLFVSRDFPDCTVDQESGLLR